MRHVWIVTRGERGEGGDVVAVLKRKPSDAKIKGLSEPTALEQWRKMVDSKRRLEFHSACDRLIAQRHEVC